MSVFKQIIELRDSIQAIYCDNAQALKWMIDGTQPVKETIDVPIRGVPYVLKFSDVSGEYKCRVQKGTTHLTEDFSFDELEDIWDEELLDNEDYTIKDLFLLAGQSTSAYEVLTQLATKYSYTNRISLTDVNQYISRAGSVDLSQLQDDFFSVSDDQGYLTLPSFMAVIKSYIESSKDAADNQSLEVDHSNPFTVQYLINIALTVVTSTLSAICYVLSNTFGAIFLVIGTIFQLIGSLWGTFNNLGNYEIDPSASSNFVCGPLSAIDRFNGSLVSKPSSSCHNRIIKYREVLGLASFLWWNDDYSDLKNNMYFYPHYKPYDAFKYLIDNNVLSFTQVSGTVWKFYISSAWDINNYLVDAPCYDDDNSSPKSGPEVLASLALGLIINQLLAWNKIVIGADETLDRSWSIQDDWYVSASPTKAADERATHEALRLIAVGYIEGNDAESFISAVSSRGLDRSFAQELTSHFSENIIPYNTSLYQRASSSNNLVVEGTSIANVSGSGTWPLIYSYAVLNPFIYYRRIPSFGCYINDYEWNRASNANCLPSSFGIKLPVANVDQITKILSVISAVAVGLSLIATPLRIAMKDRRTSQNALRADDLNKKRQEFLADPGDAEKRHEFEKAARKFDTFGRIFGWGSYDAANGWINAPVTSGSSFVSNFADSIYESYSKSSDLETILLAIRNLIKTP